MKTNKKTSVSCFFKVVVLCSVLSLVVSHLFAKEATINVNTQKVSAWSVNKLLFGRFFEHHGTDVYPGIYEQYIVNTSFEKYYHKGEDSPTPLRDRNHWLVFRDIAATEGIAEPWEPFNANAGCHYSPSSDNVNSKVSQKIVNDPEGSVVGVKQRLALPDYRCGEYRVRFYAKADQGVKAVEVRLVDYETKEVFAGKTFNVSQQWSVYSGLLNLKSKRATVKYADRHGVYELVICFKGTGPVLLDQITMFPTDVIDGRWNPETVTALKDVKVSTIRWPGGNFASSYHWQDGIGDIDKRPTKPNLTWGGLEPNHVGTDEFLQFCEMVGMTPLVCVGFDTCSVQEAANWVEYCNGDVSTPFGKLRVKNGRLKPYNIKLWQVGNEVHGDYQIGHTTAEDYAARYLDYYRAMKKVDGSIEMMAMGKDPGYQEDDDNAWNKTLFKTIGQDMDYIDIHRYVRGIRRKNEQDKWDIHSLAEVYIAFSTQYEAVIDSIRQLAKKDSLKVKLAVTEWAQYLSSQAPELPDPFSHANAVFYAGIMNTFVRNGDFVAVSCSHDLSIFMGNKPPWNVPLTPRNSIAKMYAESVGDRLLATDVDCDTFDMERNVPQMQFTKDIPYIDAIATVTEDTGRIALIIVNRSVRSDYDIRVNLEGLSGKRKAEVTAFEAVDDPMVNQTWSRNNVSKLTDSTRILDKGKMDIDIPPCSFARIIIDRFPKAN